MKFLFSNIFHLRLVESLDVEPTETEGGWSVVLKHLLFVFLLLKPPPGLFRLSCLHFALLAFLGSRRLMKRLHNYGASPGHVIGGDGMLETGSLEM